MTAFSPITLALEVTAILEDLQALWDEVSILYPTESAAEEEPIFKDLGPDPQATALFEFQASGWLLAAGR